MITLTKEQVLMLHERLIEITGGSKGIRDEGYPSVQVKAAQLCYGLSDTKNKI